jgi:hypothetical protein
MAINSNHLTGFVVGLGTAALGFYFYKKNQPKVDAWLESQGIHVGTGAGGHDLASMSTKELIKEKERLEDMIAEREIGSGEKPKE